jgi:hypothetical protein
VLCISSLSLLRDFRIIVEARNVSISNSTVKTAPRLVAVCSLLAVIALLVVGAVSHGVLRHIVQTAPLWFPIVLGLRGNALAKWTALPCFIFWQVIMGCIWLFLLGWARIITGHFSTTEIAMTMIVGVSSLLGIITAIRWRTATKISVAVGILVLFAAFQILALRISLLPAIAHR